MDWKFWVGDVGIPIITFIIGLFAGKTIERRSAAKAKVKGYIIVYKDARLNNVASVIKNRKKKKKNILMTFRPAHGNDYFYKFCKFEGIHLLDSLNITT